MQKDGTHLIARSCLMAITQGAGQQESQQGAGQQESQQGRRVNGKTIGSATERQTQRVD